MISIVVPCHNEGSNVSFLYQRVRDVFAGLDEDWELICVNDGSKDDTLDRLLALAASDCRARVIDLSRNFGKEAAMTAGLDFARGDAVIPLDADLQDPPEVIPELIAKWREGYDVVNAIRTSREGETWLKRFTAHHFYRTINRMSHVHIPEDTGDFRLISRMALDALKQLPERRRFMKGLFAWVGFRSATIRYQRAPRHAGVTNWNYWKLWNFALEGVTSFSTAPLKIATYLGLTVSALGFAYAATIAFLKIIFGNPVAGYSSIMVSILVLGGVQLVSLGIIGEYIGRIYDESKQRPIYLVRKAFSQSTAASSSDTPDLNHETICTAQAVTPAAP
jgi:polyisoprenyl-phosphate glycosyltransferase